MDSCAACSLRFGWMQGTSAISCFGSARATPYLLVSIGVLWDSAGCEGHCEEVHQNRGWGEVSHRSWRNDGCGSERVLLAPATHPACLQSTVTPLLGHVQNQEGDDYIAGWDHLQNSNNSSCKIGFMSRGCRAEVLTMSNFTAIGRY